MVKRVLRLIFALAILSGGIICQSACDPRTVPGFKQGAKRQEERITHETREAIKNSPSLQELNKLCTEGIPQPNGFVLVNMSRDFNNSRFLSYGYHSSLDYESVKRFYVDHFSQHRWNLTDEKGRGWGPPRVEFSNGQYKFTLYDMGGGDGVNYSLVCAKVD